MIYCQCFCFQNSYLYCGEIQRKQFSARLSEYSTFETLTTKLSLLRNLERFLFANFVIKNLNEVSYMCTIDQRYSKTQRNFTRLIWHPFSQCSSGQLRQNYLSRKMFSIEKMVQYRTHLNTRNSFFFTSIGSLNFLELLIVQ